MEKEIKTMGIYVTRSNGIYNTGYRGK